MHQHHPFTTQSCKKKNLGPSGCDRFDMISGRFVHDFTFSLMWWHVGRLKLLFSEARLKNGEWKIEEGQVKRWWKVHIWKPKNWQACVAFYSDFLIRILITLNHVNCHEIRKISKINISNKPLIQEFTVRLLDLQNGSSHIKLSKFSFWRSV